ncbi:MAG: monovalent cation/H+ antiporter complex subunit F [Gammaproteobacteria bacterium]
MSVSLLQLVALCLLGTGLVLGTIRFVLGPTTPDRIVAADTLSILITAGLVWLAHLLDSGIYLSIALVFGALSFVGTVALARAIEGNRS